MVNEIYLGGLEHECIMTFHMLRNQFWDTSDFDPRCKLVGPRSQPPKASTASTASTASERITWCWRAPDAAMRVKGKAAPWNLPYKRWVLIDLWGLTIEIHWKWGCHTTLFVGCKQGGRSKNVSNNFDPCVFFPYGEGYMYLRPLLRQKPCPGRFTFREGGESPWEIGHPHPPPNPPRYSTDRGVGGGKNC